MWLTFKRMLLVALVITAYHTGSAYIEGHAAFDVPAYWASWLGATLGYFMGSYPLALLAAYPCVKITDWLGKPKKTRRPTE